MSISLTLGTAETVGPPRTGSKRFWTTREIAILRANYPELGLAGCLDKLPGRSPSSVYQRACALDLDAPTETRPRVYHQPSEQIDALIRRTYEDKPDKGSVKRLSQTINRPRTWIRQRAIKLGCTVPRFKAPPWSAAEVEVIRENAHRQPATLRRMLKSAGYTRTETAIAVQLKRLGADTSDPDHYTANGLAQLFGVDRKVVTGWISQGWLRASRRGELWRIHRRDVRAFVIDNVASVHFGKVDKFWLIEILTGRAHV